MPETLLTRCHRNTSLVSCIITLRRVLEILITNSAILLLRYVVVLIAVPLSLGLSSLEC